jgi:Ribosomal protein L7/L12 C-terminal domain
MDSATWQASKPQMSVEDALQALRDRDGFDPHRKIQAIKELRYLTGLPLKEAKDAIDHAFLEKSWDWAREETPGASNGHALEDEQSLETILEDLSRHAEATAPTIEAPVDAARNTAEWKIERRRKQNREAGRRYRARIQAKLQAARPPVRPATTAIAWSLVEAVPVSTLRGMFEAAGLTLEIVAIKKAPK